MPGLRVAANQRWAHVSDENPLLTVCETQDCLRILHQVNVISYGKRLLQVYLIPQQYTLI